jgi:hypothetical protein
MLYLSVNNPSQIKDGYIYIMSHPQLHQDWVKIGRTKNIEKRRSSLAGSSLMSKFDVLFKAYCVDTVRGEKKVFSLLERYRIQGNREFFDAPLAIARDVCIEVVEHINTGKELNPAMCFDDNLIEDIQNGFITI